MKTKALILITSVIQFFSCSRTRQYDDEHFELILRNVYLRGYTECQSGNDLDIEWQVIKNEYDLNNEKK